MLSREALYPGSVHLKKAGVGAARRLVGRHELFGDDVQRILRSVCAATSLTYGTDLEASFR
jgi:hypothetical protein